MSQNATTTPSEYRADETRRIGLGALFLTGTKFYFILGSYVIYFAIGRIKGAAGISLLGDYKLVGGWLSVVSTVLVTGTTQAVARFVGRRPESARDVVRTGIGLQLGLGGVVALGLFLAAPWIADDHPELVLPLRVASAIPFVYALYAVFLGTLNGQKRFLEQAVVDGAFTTLKIVFVVAAAFVTGSATGGYAGFVAAALSVFVLAAVLVHRGLPAGAPAGAAPSGREFLWFQMQTVGFMIAVQWIVQMDLWYVVWSGVYAGPTSGPARDLYAAVQLVAQISYSAVIAVTFVLFPLVSKAAADTDRATVQAQIRGALRYAAMIVVVAAVALTAAPNGTLGLVLGGAREKLAAVPEAGLALRLLGLAYVPFALFFVMASALNAAGLARTSVAIAVVMLVVQAGLSFLWLPRFGLVGSAGAGLVAMSLGALVAFVVLGRRTGDVLPKKSYVRLLVAGLVGYAIGHFALPFDGALGSMLRVVVVAGAVILVLIVAGEFGPEDRERFRRVLRRSGGS